MDMRTGIFGEIKFNSNKYVKGGWMDGWTTTLLRRRLLLMSVVMALPLALPLALWRSILCILRQNSLKTTPNTIQV